MQTFLPYRDFTTTAKCLDYRRLGKQRVEAKQILNILLGKAKVNINGKIPWGNHPAVLMWKRYEECLKQYYNVIVLEWINRGYKNNMPLITPNQFIIYPPWLGNNKFHESHQSKLLQKDYEYYSQFNWNVDINLEYFWPTKEVVL
jgi:hypothetical protein